MVSEIIDGKAFAANLRATIKERVAQLPSQPGLAVVLVGENPASRVYVKNKIRCTHEVGMNSIEHHLPENTTEQAGTEDKSSKVAAAVARAKAKKAAQRSSTTL